MEFYATTAQVIPVLFLAMAFESRMFFESPVSRVEGSSDPKHWDLNFVFATMFTVIVMTFGEFAALYGLYKKQTNSDIDFFVWTGLGAGAIGLVLPVVGYQLSFFLQWFRALDRKLKRLYVSMMVFAIAFYIVLSMIR